MVNYKNPPEFSSNICYTQWKKELAVWKIGTDVAKGKQGPAVALSLSGKARAAALMVDTEAMAKDDGLDKVIEELDKLFQVDTLQSTFKAIEELEEYRRPSGTTITEYITEFGRLVAIVKDYRKADTYEDGIMAYRLLKQANLSSQDQQLVRATLNELTFASMVTALKRIFGDSPSDSSGSFKKGIRFKEETFYNGNQGSSDEEGEETYFNTKFNSYSRGRGAFQSKRKFYNKGQHSNETYRGQNDKSGKYKKEYRSDSPRRNEQESEQQRPGTSGTNRRENPINPQTGYASKCKICGSKFHWARNCPDAYENRKDRVLFYQSNFGEEDDMILFVGETLNKAVLDSGASKTVCGSEWLKCFEDSLDEVERMKITTEEGNKDFKFGSGVVKARCKKILPIYLCGKEHELEVYVVDCKIPLLLSLETMKKAEMNINFLEDTVEVFGKKQKLILTSSGHYTIPISKGEEDKMVNSVMFLDDQQDKGKAATKLHKRFAHASAERLIKLIKECAKVDDADLFKELKKIDEKCEFCKKHKRSAPRPTVGLPLATRFNQVVGLDLKMLSNGVWFLHCIDAVTRFSVAITIKSKAKGEIIENLFRIWISIFGAPEKYFSDNGGEFNNYDFQSMCENLNITVKTTAAESPWSNGITERHNGLIADMAEKVMEDTKCNAEVAICWASNAKNSLINVFGFSPYQLVFGSNPNIPGFSKDRLPALSCQTSSEVVAKHLNALHSAREAFIKAETNHRLKRALKGKVFTGTYKRFLSGDQVYFKREDSKIWHGPATVLGQDGSQVYIKSGGLCVRVHTCKVILKSQSEDMINEPVREHHNRDNGDSSSSNMEQRNTESSDEEEEDIHIDQTETSTTVDSNNRAENNTEEIEESVNQSENDSNNRAENNTEEIEESVNQSENGQWTKEIRKTDDGRIKLKRDDNIRYKHTEDANWKYAKVLSSGGSARGNNRNYYNLMRQEFDNGTSENGNNGEKFGVHVDQVILEKRMENEDDQDEIILNDTVQTQEHSITEADTYFTIVPEARHNEIGIRQAKEREMENWRAFDVFEEIVKPENEPIITTRWVITEKENKFKARLVARGFQEQDNSIPSDSPTVNKSSLRLFLALISLNGWQCETMDVRAAFLQGKAIDRRVLVQPPKDLRNDETVWLLKKTIYGLGDAARCWFLTVSDKLKKLGCTQSLYDKAVFTAHRNNKFKGLFGLHVDDFLYAGDKEFLSNTIGGLRREFDIGESKCKNFVYLGWDMQQTEHGITINQQKYADEISCVKLGPGRRQQKTAELNQKEIKEYQSLLGQLSWVANQTRPDLKFSVLEASLFSKHPTVEDLLNLNKAVKKLQDYECKLFLPKLDREKELKIIVFSDASHANLADKCSSGRGHVTFLSDSVNSCVISWASNKIKRVVKSTLAAEGLSLLEALEEAIYLRVLLSEIMYNEPLDERIKIYAYTDNKSLYENVYSSKQASEKLLRIELAAIEQMLDKKQVQSIGWISTDKMLADSLTKKNASGERLISSLYSGKIDIEGIDG